MAKKVLVVEKDRQLLEFMRTTLEELEYIVMVAEDSGSGFRLARKNQPDLSLAEARAQAWREHPELKTQAREEGN